MPPEEIKQNAIRAVELDPNDGLAHRTAAFGYLYERRLELFEREAELAFQLAPYNADIFAQLGMAIAMTGQWERGMKLVTKAHQLNPVSTAGWYENALHYDYYRKGEYDKALGVLADHPGQMLCQTQFKYVAAYGQLGRPQEAKSYWDRCAATVAGFSPGRVAELLRVWNLPESFIAHYMEGIAKAGYPCRRGECGLRSERRTGGEVTE
jgi:tetratricopeptide (TPR) repeat protein